VDYHERRAFANWRGA